MTDWTGREGSPEQRVRTDRDSPGDWSQVVHSLRDGVYRLDADGRFVAVNDAIVDVTGYARAELLGEPVSMLIAEADADRLEHEIRTRLDSGTDPDTTFTFAVHTRSGGEITCDLRFSLLVEDGTFAGTVGVVRPAEGSDQPTDRLPSIWETYESISSVIDEADVGVFVLDDSFDVVWIDESVEEYFGLDRDDVVGRDKRTLIEERIGDRFADSDAFAETVLATYEDNSYVEQFECLITGGPAREERWLEHRSKPIDSGRYAGGRVELYYDVTDRKDAERARRESENRLRREHELTERILETSPVGIAVVNRDGTIARENDRIADLFGIDGDDGILRREDRTMFDANGEPLSAGDRPVDRVFETGTPVVDQEVLLDDPGRRRWLSITAKPIGCEGGEPEQVIEIATDITDLKELAERRRRDLREREKELAAVRLVTGLIESEDRSVDSLLERFVTNLPDFFQAPDRTEVRVAVGANEAMTDDYESIEPRITTTSRTVNGTRVAIDVVLRVADDPDDGADAFLDEERELLDTLTTLLTFSIERREYVADLQASNERLEQFAYAASHDLQEPLRMVSSYLQLIEDRYADELDDEGEEFIAFAVDSAERMREMIDGLLAYARVETRGDPFEPVDLDAVVAATLSDLSLQIEAHDADITAESLPVVEGDASQLRQVFQNLLDNAIEYSADGPPRVNVGAERDGAEAIISVRDEGIGIESENRDRIFEVFQRLHTGDEHPGTGIGLALSRRIVERHDGDLWVESEQGEGSTFSFTLPLSDDGDR